MHVGGCIRPSQRSCLRCSHLRAAPAPWKCFDQAEPSVWADAERGFGFCSHFFVQQLAGLNRVSGLANAGGLMRRRWDAVQRTTQSTQCGNGKKLVRARRRDLAGGEAPCLAPLPCSVHSLADTGEFPQTNSHHHSCVTASRGGKRLPKSRRRLGLAVLPTPAGSLCWAQDHQLLPWPQTGMSRSSPGSN